jgi:hypothetical protein
MLGFIGLGDMGLPEERMLYDAAMGEVCPS